MTKTLGMLWVIGTVCASVFADGNTFRDIYPDTWVATDALGRVMPDADTVGLPKNDQPRVVGIFYITWHSDWNATRKNPYAADISKILKADPAARLDANHPLWGAEPSYHWGEPELGYFLSKDEYVIRRDMSMLSDAGVDVLVMDVTNAVCYWEEWDTIFNVMLRMRAEGNKVPQFCFWAFNGPCITVVQDLYERIYKEGKYKDLWFYWKGKPLLLYNGTPTVDANGGGIKHPNRHYDPAAKTDPNHPHYGDPQFTEEFYSDYTQEVKDFFTLRTMWWGYYEWAGKRAVGTQGYWSFGYDLGDPRVKGMDPDALVSPWEGVKEQAAVTPAQHPASCIGKSWSREYGEPELNEYDLPVPTFVPWLGKTVEHPEGYGIYFQERWDEAIKAQPQFLYINDWNEWTAGKYQPGEGKTVPFLRRNNSFFFVDQYNAEFNRTIQPMKGGYTDNYYMQMVQNIRRYKGVRPIPRLKGFSSIDVDGQFDDWKNVSQEYRDTIGDTVHRDYPGYGGLHYTDNSGRNDIITSKVAVSGDKIFFYVETREPMTPCTDPHWMLLLIDSDHRHETGWEGYDYMVNSKIIDQNTAAIMRFDAEGAENRWKEIGQVRFASAGNALELSIPRGMIGLEGTRFVFDFKWTDNPSSIDDIIAICTSGDTAPNRRFNYRCIWETE